MLLTPEDRVRLYNGTFPKYPALSYTQGHIVGTWMLGNDYRGSGFYGSYPPSYLKRVWSLFPDMDKKNKRVLHLFAGSLKRGEVKGETVDINPELEPDHVHDAHDLSSLFKPEVFDFVVADPPYSKEDARHYGTSTVNRRVVFQQCYQIVKPGGFMVWLDTRIPMWRKEQWKVIGEVGIWRSSNHRVRMMSIWKRLLPSDTTCEKS